MSEAHTPLSWSADGLYGIAVGGVFSAAFKKTDLRDEAIRAVNCHAELVNVLSDLREMLRNDPAVQTDKYKDLGIRVNDALARAKVQP